MNIERLLRAYVGALDLSAVYVLRVSAAVRVGSSSDPADVLKRAGAEAVLAFVGWCRNKDRAFMAVELCQRALGDRGLKLVRGAVAAPAEDVVRVLVDVAATIGLELQDEEEVRAIALATVQHVEETFERMMHAGGLRDLNRRYREHRLARVAAGERAQPYSAWIANQKVALIRSTADMVASTSGRLPPHASERCRSTKGTESEAPPAR